MGVDTLRRVIEAEAEQVTRLSQTIDYEALARLSELIASCEGSVFVTGCGTSAMAARKAVHTLSVVGQRAFYLNPSDAVHGELGVVRKGDVVILISKGGATAELTSFLPNLAEKGAIVVGVGEHPESPIGQASDLFLRVEIEREPDPFNMLATASTLAVIAALDAVAIDLMEGEEFSRAAFLENHPSGDVGERLAQGQE